MAHFFVLFRIMLDMKTVEASSHKTHNAYTLSQFQIISSEISLGLKAITELQICRQKNLNSNQRTHLNAITNFVCFT